MLSAVDGITVGHWTDPVARTGCTVVLLPEASVASGEVRGGAPATREFELLAPGRTVDHVDAVVMTGGSAFGLASADGVVRWLEARGTGFATRWGPVPIVVAMGLFDLAVGDPAVRPGAVEGEAAAASAGPDAASRGAVGAGAGCSVDKWHGDPDRVGVGGLGSAVQRDGDLVVAALVAVNAAGAVDGGITAARVADGSLRPSPATDPFANTTIGVIATNARLDKQACHLVAQGGHDGYARAIFPAHRRSDGDAVVAVATGAVHADVDWVRTLAVLATEAAIVAAVGGDTAGTT